MSGPVTFSTTIEDVDWTALKDDLVSDDFDNLTTPDEMRRPFENSHAVALAWDGERVVGTARVLADGVSNAYIVDVWTHSSLRRRGIASELVRMLLATVPGHHVGLFAVGDPTFYERLGFTPERGGMALVVGRWLGRYEPKR